MHVPGGCHAWRHFQDIDHGLLHFLILTSQIVAQDLRELWSTLRSLGQHRTSAGRNCCCGCGELQKATANECHASSTGSLLSLHAVRPTPATLRYSPERGDISSRFRDGEDR